MNKRTVISSARIRELESFAAAARCLNFSHAAREVGCTPSVLSRRIASLEEELGSRLFRRTTRRMNLTARGEQLLVHCQQLEQVMGELANEMRPDDGAPSGRLRVHLPAAYGRHCLAPRLAAFMRRYPLIRVEATYEDAYVDLVQARVDLAVRVGVLADAQLMARNIGSMPRLLCASPEYLASAPPLAEPSDLKRHRCIAFSELRTGTLWQLRKGRSRRSIRIEPVLASNDAQAIRDAALAGVGIALQGAYMVDELLADGRLVEVLPEWSLSRSPVHLLWLPGSDREHAVRCLIDFLEETQMDE